MDGKKASLLRRYAFLPPLMRDVRQLNIRRNSECTHCGNTTNTPLMRGNGWIEIVAYLFLAIVGGVIYSIWRRMIPPNVCPSCKKESIIENTNNESSVMVSCEWCAEKIQPEAKICKHCNREVEPQPVSLTIKSSVDTSVESQSVSTLLGLGIFFIPYIFVWFLLREGYTKKSKYIGFSWLAFVIIFTLIMPNE